MSSILFQLSLTDGTLNFFGPDQMTEADFQSLCLSLIDEAAWIALEGAREEAKTDDARMISWRDIAQHIPRLLDKHGFTEVKPKWASMPTYEIVERHSKLPGDLLHRTKTMIEEWNDMVRSKVQRRLAEEHEMVQAKKIADQPGEIERLKKLIGLAEDMKKEKKDG